MDSLNADLDPFERISSVVVADGPWTIANGFLTPTLKLRRSLLEDCYQQKIGRWLPQKAPIVWESLPAQAPPAATGSSPPSVPQPL